jgi:hypothetical protein
MDKQPDSVGGPVPGGVHQRCASRLRHITSRDVNTKKKLQTRHRSVTYAGVAHNGKLTAIYAYLIAIAHTGAPSQQQLDSRGVTPLGRGHQDSSTFL